MTYAEYQKELKKVKAFLDTINIEPLLNKRKNLYDIYDTIELLYGKRYKEKYGEELFDVMDPIDFGDYLTKKYSVYIQECTYYEVVPK